MIEWGADATITGYEEKLPRERTTDPEIKAILLDGERNPRSVRNLYAPLKKFKASDIESYLTDSQVKPAVSSEVASPGSAPTAHCY